MATAGIKRNDTATQKKYLRYCEEYRTAWIEFLPQVCETIMKFDGKKITKRIDTAIKKIDDRMRFRIEKSTYDNSTGYVYFDWFDYEGRQFRDDVTGQWDYVKDFPDCGILMHRINDMECFDANQLIEALKGRAEYYTGEHDNVCAALDDIESLKEEYNAALKAFNEIRNKIPCQIKDYYKINSCEKWY